MPKPSAAKSLAADEAQVRRRWAGLSVEQRAAATRFEDPVLVRCIRDAVQTLFQQQVVMAQMGMRARGSPEPDLFVDSMFLKDVFDLQWIVEKSDEHPDAVLMNPDAQPSWMRLQEAFLEGFLVFEICQGALPNFLASKTGRSPMPRARWKQLWAAEPSSVAALEQQLAKLLEQALWAMTSTLPMGEAATPRQTATEAEVPFEDWMGAPPGKISPKQKKKKNSQQSLKAGSVPETEPEMEPHSSEAAELSPGGVDGTVCAEKPNVSLVGDEQRAGDEPQPEIAVDVEERASQLEEAVVSHHYWDWHEAARERRRPMLRWCLPMTSWSRGHWAREALKGDSAAQGSQGPAAIVRNTFIEVFDDDGAERGPQRLSRSLSPSAMRK
ncbi:unnamed protein product [Polarella glacialis]|uniref:Uncharacterized protein n=1 Tax=Polarella glacialis TaxID=89957 RepID=A0A813IF59_POLGL|nr:unnamed protein product [Polarella glacialis]